MTRTQNTPPQKSDSTDEDDNVEDRCKLRNNMKHELEHPSYLQLVSTVVNKKSKSDKISMSLYEGSSARADIALS